MDPRVLDPVLAKLLANPIAAATCLEQLAMEFLEVAKALRQAAADAAQHTPGGMTDVVHAHVLGPDGQLKQVVHSGDQ
jgi:hypothetical protein